MPLPSGARLGPYEIVSALGEGGMGEVYKARDTRLDRTVAIKVLPPELSADPERRRRFELEAGSIAALNHPHICTLHDIGVYDGSTFLVMEHLTGETLAARLEKGPLPLDEALTIGAEIADALAAAHRQGIVHRDLKPGNVMLTRPGAGSQGLPRAKLLDFGLAKLTGHGDLPAGVPDASALTAASPLTGPGVILGTPHYMAPEQLEGKPTDARTDLWAFGAILFEIVTGRRAFEGSSGASLIASIMHAAPPPLAALRPLTPPALDRLVRQCLAKSPEDRWESARDAAFELRWLRGSAGDAASAPRPSRARHLAWAAILVLSGALAGAGIDRLLQPAGPRSSAVLRTSVDVRPADELNAGSAGVGWMPTPGGSRTALAWTPDGRALVFVGRLGGTQQLFVRPLDQGEARALPGTEGAQVPAVSLDGQSIAFWSGGVLRKVPLGGGPVADVASGVALPPAGLAWDGHGNLFYSRDDGRIWKVPPGGGPVAVSSGGRADFSHLHPTVLPGDRVLLYTVRRRLWSWGDEEIMAQTLAAGTRKSLLRDACDARYLPTGHLVFMRRGVLFAVAFDPEQLEFKGAPVAIVDGIAQALLASLSDDVSGAGQFAVASTGTLAWLPSPVMPYPDAVIVAADRQGQLSPLGAPAKSYASPVRLSSDGQQVLVTIRSAADSGAWAYDLSRKTLTPLTHGGEAQWPLWTLDGQRVVFNWLEGGRESLAWRRADATSPLEESGTGNLFPSSWAPGGKQLAVVTAGDIVVATVENGRATMQPVTRTPDIERWPEFSPDGRWLAYGSNVTGRFEVYVQPYPGPGPRVQVSIDGAESPKWLAKGRELSFVSPADAAGKRRLLVATFEPASPPRVGTPRPLFDFDGRELAFSCLPVRCYDATPDGQRFFVVQRQFPPPSPPVTHVNLVANWFEELKARVPKS